MFLTHLILGAGSNNAINGLWGVAAALTAVFGTALIAFCAWMVKQIYATREVQAQQTSLIGEVATATTKLTDRVQELEIRGRPRR
jgi:hypothetical protein